MSEFKIKNATQLQVYIAFMSAAINGILASWPEDSVLMAKHVAEQADSVAIEAMLMLETHVPDVFVGGGVIQTKQ
jgi:hypothetical protein